MGGSCPDFLNITALKNTHFIFYLKQDTNKSSERSSLLRVGYEIFANTISKDRFNK